MGVTGAFSSTGLYSSFFFGSIYLFQSILKRQATWHKLLAPGKAAEGEEEKEKEEMMVDQITSTV